MLLAWQPVPLLADDLYPALGRTIRLAYLITICFLFFGWFWCHGGQTMGMRLANQAGCNRIIESVRNRVASRNLARGLDSSFPARHYRASLSGVIIGLGR